MQSPGDEDLAAAVLSSGRSFEHQLLVDWDRDGQFAHAYSDLSVLVDSASINKSLTGALPPSTTIVEGTSATELKLVLSGSRTPDEPAANVIFSRYNPVSPLYGQTIRNTPVQYSIVVHDSNGAPIPVRQFTGRIRISAASADKLEVPVNCLDAVEDLQRPIWLPAHGSLYGTDVSQQFSSHWVMDRVLRANGYYQTPPPHPNACYYATLHGGTAPEIGMTAYGTLINGAGTWRWTGGGSEPMYFDTGTGDEFQTNGNTRGSGGIPRPNVGNTVGLGWRIKRVGTNSGVLIQNLNSAPLNISIPGIYDSSSYSARIMLHLTNTGQIRLQLTNSYNGATYDKSLYHATTITDSAWHYVQAECTFNSTSVTFRVKLDGGAWQTSTQTGAYPAITAAAPFPPYPYIEWPLWIQMQAFHPVTNIQSYCGTTPMVDAYPASFVPNARLDQAHNRLTAVPEFRKEPSWNILKELANTEFGSLYVDEYGVVQFANMHSARVAKTVPDRAVDTSTIGGLTITDATDNCVNVCAGRIKPFTIGPRCVFDLAGQFVLYDKTGAEPVQTTIRELDDMTAQPVSGFPAIRIWPEIKSMVYPTSVGRNVVGTYPVSAWDSAEETIMQGICAVHATNGTAAGTNATVDVWPDEQSTLYLAIFNQGNAYAVQISNAVIDAGNPPGSSTGSRTRKYCLKIAGMVLLEEPVIEYERKDSTSISENGHQPLDMPDNEWCQSYAAMTYIADELLSDMSKNPIPLVDDITLPGDPRVQLGDTLDLTDAGALGGKLLAVVSGLTRSLGSDGLADTYSMKLITRPGEWILGDPVYSVLGTSTILS